MTRHITPLLRNRDFMLLWQGAAISGLGSNATAVAYPLLVLQLTGSPADAGLTGFVALLPQLLFQMPAGVLVDRWDRRAVMIWCDVLRGLAIGSLVVALAAGALGMPQVLLVGFVEGTATVCFALAETAAVPNLVDPSQLAAALSRNEARTRGATMAGQPLGGLLFGLGRALPFLFDALSYAVSMTTLLLIRRGFQAEAAASASADAGAGGRTRAMLRELVEGVVWLWRQPFLRTSTALVAGSNFLFQALFLTVIMVARDGGASSGAVGVMFGVAAVGGVLGSLAAPALERRLSLPGVVIGANVAWALLVPVLLLVHDPYAIGGVYALMCFVGPVWNVVVVTYQLAVTPDRIQGRVQGAAGMLAFGALPLGSLAGGLLLRALGPEHTVAVLAGWMAFLAVAAAVSPAVRRVPAAAKTAEPAAEHPADPQPATVAP